MALDVVATPTLELNEPLQKVPFLITGYEADASTAIEILAAPGVGKAIRITRAVIVNIDDDAAVRLQDEDDNLLVGPVAGVAAGGPGINVPFAKPIKMVANKALEVKAAAGGIFSLIVEGYVAEV